MPSIYEFRTKLPDTIRKMAHDFDFPQPKKVDQLLYEIKTKGNSVGCIGLKVPEQPTCQPGYSTVTILCRLLKVADEFKLVNINDNSILIRNLEHKILNCKTKINDLQNNEQSSYEKTREHVIGKAGKNKKDKKNKTAAKKLKKQIENLEKVIKQCSSLISLLGGSNFSQK